jgi:CRP-like cAMP-binding protein
MSVQLTVPNEAVHNSSAAAAAADGSGSDTEDNNQLTEKLDQAQSSNQQLIAGTTKPKAKFLKDHSEESSEEDETNNPPIKPSPSTNIIDFANLQGSNPGWRELLQDIRMFITFRSLLDPNSSRKWWWDWIIIFFVLYNAFIIPWYIAFDVELASKLNAFDIVTTVGMALDIFIILRTGFIDFSGNVVYDSKRIASRYWRRGLLLDVLGTFPFEIFASLFRGDQAFISNCLKAPGIIRATRLVYNERIEIFNSPLQRIAKLLFGFFYLAHLFGAIFYFVGRYQPGASEVSWIVNCGIEGANPTESYIASLYWSLATMVTVGYGDIHATTVYEQATVIPILLLSALIYAMIFGNMAYAIETLTATIRRYQTRMDNVKEFIKVYELPGELQKKLYNYNDEMWNQNKGFESDAMLAHLPTSVKAEVMMFINQSLIERVPLLKQCSDRFLEAIILRMSTQVCLPGDYIFREGDKSREMYFIRTGTVEIIMEDPVTGSESAIATLHSFSESPFFGEISLLLGETRTASAKASTKCVLTALSQQDFFEVLSMFPDEENSLRETAAQRLQEDIEREQRQLERETARKHKRLSQVSNNNEQIMAQRHQSVQHLLNGGVSLVQALAASNNSPNLLFRGSLGGPNASLLVPAGTNNVPSTANKALEHSRKLSWGGAEESLSNFGGNRGAGGAEGQELGQRRLDRLQSLSNNHTPAQNNNNHSNNGHNSARNPDNNDDRLSALPTDPREHRKSVDLTVSVPTGGIARTGSFGARLSSVDNHQQRLRRLGESTLPAAADRIRRPSVTAAHLSAPRDSHSSILVQTTSTLRQIVDLADLTSLSAQKTNTFSPTTNNSSLIQVNSTHSRDNSISNNIFSPSAAPTGPIPLPHTVNFAHLAGISSEHDSDASKAGDNGGAGNKTPRKGRQTFTKKDAAALKYALQSSEPTNQLGIPPEEAVASNSKDRRKTRDLEELSGLKHARDALTEHKAGSSRDLRALSNNNASAEHGEKKFVSERELSAHSEPLHTKIIGLEKQLGEFHVKFDAVLQLTNALAQHLINNNNDGGNNAQIKAAVQSLNQQLSGLKLKNGPVRGDNSPSIAVKPFHSDGVHQAHNNNNNNNKSSNNNSVAMVSAVGGNSKVMNNSSRAASLSIEAGGGSNDSTIYQAK